MATKDTTAPSGLAISRNGEKLVLKWKQKGPDYKGGQEFKYRIRTQVVTTPRKKGKRSWGKWHEVNIGTGTTAKSITIDRDNYFPFSKKKYLIAVEFAVRGKRKKDSNHSYKWSKWTNETYSYAAPVKPALSISLKDSTTGINASWSISTSLTNKRLYTRVRLETILTKDGADPNWKNAEVHTYTATSGTYSKNEDTSVIGSGSHTRHVRVRGEGPYGPGAWQTKKYVYALPYQAKNVVAVYTEDAETQETNLVVTWSVKINAAHPVDRTFVEYAIATPDANLTCPEGASWTEGRVSKDIVDLDEKKKSTGSSTSKAEFSIDDVIGPDKCLFVRVNTQHGFDENINRGKIVRAAVGFLKDPEINSVSDLGGDSATITVTNTSDVEDSFIVIVCRKENEPDKDLVIGITNHSGGSIPVKIPNRATGEAVRFGAYAMVGTATLNDLGDGFKTYVVNSLMRSENTVWSGGEVPKAPTGVVVRQTEVAGTIRVNWNWDWLAADNAILSWADHADAWESTDEPEEYTVSQMYASAWNISGLETGKTWYVRVRLTKGLGDDVTYGPWSDIYPIPLTSAPNIPTMVLSADVITMADQVTASWAYSSTDGTAQAYAKICEATVDNNGLHYGVYGLTEDTEVVEDKEYFSLDNDVYTLVVNPTGNPSENGYYEIQEVIIAHAETAQHVDIIPSEIEGWTAGETHYLCLRVLSASGKSSDNWSDPVQLTIAEPVQITGVTTSLQTITISEDDEEGTTREQLSLVSMPMTVTVTGAGEGGRSSVIIERYADYHLERPDETDFNGFAGETIYLSSHSGEGQFEINPTDLIGALDDEASYNLIVSISDVYGQTAQQSIPFEVHWSHQAIIPDATGEMDLENMIATITASVPSDVPTGWVLDNGDTFDIYRLSADRPELIIENGLWDTEYVDPYPAMGVNGGYRVVFKTVNGDYITEENLMAWVDLDEDDEMIFEPEEVKTIIDFNGRRILLSRNVDLENQWAKDFQETKYLGGSIQGDWNPAVSRSGSVTTTTLTLLDQDVIAEMRRLAVYSGVCHIRTFDGTSMPCDIQVSEERSHDSYGEIVDFSLTITRVDPEGFEGMTLEQWQKGQDE